MGAASGWLSIEADPVYQTILITAEKAFWRAVETGESPVLFDCEPPKLRIEAVRMVDMSASNSWAKFAALLRETQGAHADHGACQGRTERTDGRVPLTFVLRFRNEAKRRGGAFATPRFWTWSLFLGHRTLAALIKKRIRTTWRESADSY
jgi:hypothetical protein